MTVRALAKRAEINESYLSELGSGRVETPRPETKEKLAKALGVSPSIFYDETPTKTPSSTISDSSRGRDPVPQRTWRTLVGHLSAGIPADLIGQNMGKVELDAALLAGASDPEAVVIVQIDGDSLEGDDIHDGYYAAIDPLQKQPIDGKIYVVRTDHVTAALHIWKKNGQYRLASSNGQYKDLEPDQFSIQGRLIAAWKPPRTY
jgi:SOS-response transcriptional repressor LexA